MEGGASVHLRLSHCLSTELEQIVPELIYRGG
jgi:hypothetical protein